MLIITLGTTAAVLALAASVWILVRQQRQSDQLVELHEGSRELVVTLDREDRRRRATAECFAPLRPGMLCRVAVPVRFRRAPMPQLAPGDAHTVEVLQRHLGAERLRVHALAGRAGEVEGLALHDGGTFVLVGDPGRNPAVEYLLPPVVINEKNGAPQAPHGLPCWFAKGCEQRQAAIVVMNPRGGISEEIVSDAVEQRLLAARALKSGAAFEPFFAGDRWSDHGLLARLHLGDKHVFVVAGTTDLGTWIAADYLDQLLGGNEDLDASDTVRANEDFVALIWGEFVPEEMRVSSSGILRNYCWQFRGRWEQVRSTGAVLDGF